MTKKELLKLCQDYFSKHYYINYSGDVQYSFNECYCIEEHEPDICEIIRQFITENWKEEREQSNNN